MLKFSEYINEKNNIKFKIGNEYKGMVLQKFIKKVDDFEVWKTDKKSEVAININDNYLDMNVIKRK